MNIKEVFSNYEEVIQIIRDYFGLEGCYPLPELYLEHYWRVEGEGKHDGVLWFDEEPTPVDEEMKYGEDLYRDNPVILTDDYTLIKVRMDRGEPLLMVFDNEKEVKA